MDESQKWQDYVELEKLSYAIHATVEAGLNCWIGGAAAETEVCQFLIGGGF